MGIKYDFKFDNINGEGYTFQLKIVSHKSNVIYRSNPYVIEFTPNDKYEDRLYDNSVINVDIDTSNRNVILTPTVKNFVLKNDAQVIVIKNYYESFLSGVIMKGTIKSYINVNVKLVKFNPIKKPSEIAYSFDIKESNGEIGYYYLKYRSENSKKDRYLYLYNRLENKSNPSSREDLITTNLKSTHDTIITNYVNDKSKTKISQKMKIFIFSCVFSMYVKNIISYANKKKDLKNIYKTYKKSCQRFLQMLK